MAARGCTRQAGFRSWQDEGCTDVLGENIRTLLRAAMKSWSVDLRARSLMLPDTPPVI